MAKTKFENFNAETINRRDIKNAEYNPRIMTKDAKKRLKKSIQEDGLVSALTWNRRTGNLVGGHQRLEQLDALEGSQDYDLTVCVIDVDEREEAKLNVKLNNPSMQGDWDIDKLALMTEEFDLSIDDMGFASDDAALLFDGDDRFTDLYDTPEAEAEKDKIRQIKEEREKIRVEEKKNNDANFMVVVVFKDSEERDEFMKRIHVQKWEQYVTAEQVYRLSAQ